jgi:hypothetical protein
MTTQVKISVNTVHTGKHVRVQQIDRNTEQPTGNPVALGAYAQVEQVVYESADIRVSEHEGELPLGYVGAVPGDPD